MVAFVYFLVTHSYLCWSSDLIKPQCFLLDPSVLLGSPLFRLVHSSTNLQQPSQTFILVTSNLHHISNFAGSKPYLVGGLEHQFYFPIYIYILGMSSSQLTFIFFRGVAQPPTSYTYTAKNPWFPVDFFLHPLRGRSLLRRRDCATSARSWAMWTAWRDEGPRSGNCRNWMVNWARFDDMY